MKTFSASDLGSHKRTEIFEAAKDGGCIIERKNTNGAVLDQFVIIPNDSQAICQLYTNDELNPVGMR